jgi:hypothetical protein
MVGVEGERVRADGIGGRLLSKHMPAPETIWMTGRYR